MPFEIRNYLSKVKNTDARSEITLTKKTLIENNDDGTIKSEILHHTTRRRTESLCENEKSSLKFFSEPVSPS